MVEVQAIINKEEIELLFSTINKGPEYYVDPNSPNIVDKIIERWFNTKGYDFWNNPYPEVTEWSFDEKNQVIQFKYLNEDNQLKINDMSITLNIAREFSPVPGARFKNQGDFSGEEFREKLLYPRYINAIVNNTKLIVNLDGAVGYAASFLDEAFGGLVTKHFLKAKEILETIDIVSEEEDYLKEDIIGYINSAIVNPNIELNNSILTEEEAKTIAGNIADSYGPDEDPLSEEDFLAYVKDITGKSRLEAAKILWPDNEEEQLFIINDVLTKEQIVKSLEDKEKEIGLS